MTQNIYDKIMDEKRRREEEEEAIRIREEKQAAALKKLNKAAEFVQAHWKGLLTRKDKGLKKSLGKIKKKKKKMRKKRA